jgi:uncharacterized protein YjiK
MALREPSGIVYHRERGSLFVADDRGYVAEMTRTGAVLHCRLVEAGLDLEGITVGPGGRLYLVAEAESPLILEVDPDGLRELRRWTVDGAIAGARPLAGAPGKGLEGLCYVPEAERFFAVNQDKPARLVQLDLRPAAAATGAVRVERIVADLEGIVRARASDLAHDPASGHFLVVESDTGAGKGELYELTREGICLRRLRLPGERQEGFALDDRGSAFVAQDSGGVLRIDPPPGR